MPISHFNLPPLETYLSVLEILIIKNEKAGIMENCLKSRYFSAFIKGVIDIRGTSELYVCERNVYFYIVVFSESVLYEYFNVRSNLCLIDFEYF